MVGEYRTELQATESLVESTRTWRTIPSLAGNPVSSSRIDSDCLLHTSGSPRPLRTRYRAIMSRRRHRLVAALAVIMIVAGCGDDDPLTGAAPGDETGDDDVAADLADAMGAGGGGTLSFEGEQIVIDSVVCSFDGELFDVGTVSESGHRVLLSWTNELNPVSIQVLDADFQQWFHEGDAVYERDGTVFTSPTSTYWANGTDDTREIGFTVECP
jgi:hypothetical protein